MHAYLQPFVPESVCSKPCGPKQIYLPRQLPCCWDCVTCRPDEILINKATACQSCPELTWPDDKTSTTCLLIPPYVFNESSPIAKTLVAIATVVLSITLFITGMFIYYRQTKIIKATSFSHSLMILVAATLACVDVIIICQLKLTDANCTVGFGIFHLSVCFLFAPLLIKNIRVYRIFAAGRRGLMKPKFITGKIQLLFITIILSVQVNIKSLRYSNFYGINY